MSEPAPHTLTGWRKKDRYRFRNADLVCILFETGCREVFDLHEVICDFIDEEQTNLIKVSLLTLCIAIHDHPRLGDQEWERQRLAVLEKLRERELVRFDGDVTLTGELAISLPDRVYKRWHESADKKAKNERPRDPKTGRLLPKTPAPTPDPPTGPQGAPHGSTKGSPQVPSETETETEKVGMAVVDRPLPASVRETIKLVRDIPGLPKRQLESNVQKAMAQFPSLSDEAVCEAITAFEANVPEGSAIHPGSAWTKLRNCFSIARKIMDEEAAVSSDGPRRFTRGITPHTDEWRQQAAASLGPLPSSGSAA